MDTQTLLNLGLVLLFVVVGGVFAGTEIALVSLRESQLDQLERKGGRGARVASVARDPNRFLAAVQIGVTVAGFFSAAYGASTLAPDFAPALVALGVPTGAADTLALVALTLAIAYTSLVLGELVPKRMALQRSASVAVLVGPPLDRFATLMRPVVWFLSVSTNGVVRLLGGDPHAASEEMSDEELRYLVDQHQGLEPAERQILTDVFDAGDSTLREVMRPRGDAVVLGATTTVDQAVSTVLEHPFSRYPVVGRGPDDVHGFLHVRDLLGADPQAPVSSLAREIAFLPGTNKVLPTLAWMRDHRSHIAVVVDEYGGTDGIVTLEDLVEELVGEIHDEYDAPLAHARNGTGGLDAGLSIEDFGAASGLVLPDGPYETAAGFVLHRLGRIAHLGDRVPVGDAELHVVGLAGHRITRLEVQPAPPVAAPD